MSRGIFLVLFSLILGTVQLSLISIQLSFIANQLQNLILEGHLWFVSWDIIYHKSAPSKTRFFSLSLLQKVTSTSEFTLFSPLLASFLSSWTILLFFMNYYSTSSLIRLSFLLCFSFNAFLHSLKILHMLYKQKRPCKAGWNVYMGKKRPTKARSRFYESGIPVRWENLFSYKQILIFQ